MTKPVGDEDTEGIKSRQAATEFVLVPSDPDPELMEEFLAEAREQLEQCEAALLRLEANPGDSAAVDTAFRGFHTIKGTAACLGLSALSKLSHRAESLLSRIREGEIRCTGDYAELVFRSIDALKALLDLVGAASRGEAVELPEGTFALLEILADPETAGFGVGTARTTAALDVRPGGAQETAVESMRVRTDRLDRLVNLVEELVVAQSMVVQDSGSGLTEGRRLRQKIAHAGKIVRDLHDLSLRIRMVPLSGVFRKLVRAVRDLVPKSGKQVEFTTSGEETEIDRRMVDAMSDPLVHLIRNAIDHGIEDARTRVANGKEPTGRVRLDAYHSGGCVVVRLEDDGRGLDRDKILTKALAHGRIRRSDSMTESEIFGLIFEPGLSTAERLTDVSGRGVGLDVVKRTVEMLQGQIAVASTAGAGTTFSLRLPLTVAVADGMRIRVGAQRFIVPMTSILMSVRPKPGDLSTFAGGGQLVHVRGEWLPVLRLGELFDIPNACADPCEGFLMILDDRHGRFALFVDDLLGQQQVVVKSLRETLGRTSGVSGAAILGDGTVGLILEPAELAILAEISREPGNAAVCPGQPSRPLSVAAEANP